MNLVKALLFAVVMAYGWELFMDGREPPLLRGINLVFHEAGHVFFAPLGRVPGILGGSLFEIGLPFSIGLLALWRVEMFPFGMCLAWTASACHSVGVYAGDAVARRLPLLGGDAVIHDWHFLLRHWGALDRTAEIAAWFWWAGALCLGVGLVAMAWDLFAPNRRRTNGA